MRGTTSQQQPAPCVGCSFLLCPFVVHNQVWESQLTLHLGLVSAAAAELTSDAVRFLYLTRKLTLCVQLIAVVVYLFTGDVFP